jgi:citrate lyase subunit beta/citryl-CoA lyase
VIATWKKSGKVAAVRINPLEDPDGIKDLRAAISANVDTVLLPKANYSYQIDKLIKHINDLEQEFGKEINSTEIVPNIEQAIGFGKCFINFRKKTKSSCIFRLHQRI